MYSKKSMVLNPLLQLSLLLLPLLPALPLLRKRLLST